jgi:hypothetical protein
LGIIGSELMMKLGIINSEDFHHLRRLRIWVGISPGGCR